MLKRIEALHRWSRLLNTARPDDIPAVLAGLSESDLAAVVDIADAPVSMNLCEYVLAHGASASLVALARRAVLGECDQGEQSLYPGYLRWFGWFGPYRRRRTRRTQVLPRILRRRDPEVDAAVFDLDDTLELVRTSRADVLSHRRGSDGRASIPPQVKKRLLDSAAEHAAHPGRPLPALLLSELATADDADLVRAALLHHHGLTDQEKALALDTLARRGRRDEAKELYPELWNEFPRAARRTARRTTARDAGYSYRGPAGPAVVSLRQYIKVAKQKDKHQEKGWVLRRFAMDALRTGAITAADIVAHSRPAAVALTLTCCTNDDELRPGARRAADDMRILISERLAATAGDDYKSWARLISCCVGFRGTFPDLLACLERGFPQQSYRFKDHSALGPWDARNVLSAMAPPEIAARLLEDASRWGDDLRSLAASAPLTRQLVDRITLTGTEEQRTALAGNDATPDSVLARLLENPELTSIIAKRRFIGPGTRFAALARYVPGRRRGEFGDPVVDVASRGPEPLLSTLRSATDPAQLLVIIEAVAAVLTPDTRVAAYSILAQAAGPEAVWALELARAGSLEEMDPEVLASMAAGSWDPVHPDDTGIDDLDSASVKEAWRADERLDEPFAYPLASIVRAHLDGHPGRWLTLLDLITAEPEAGLEELVAQLPQ